MNSGVEASSRDTVSPVILLQISTEITLCEVTGLGLSRRIKVLYPSYSTRLLERMGLYASVFLRLPTSRGHLNHHKRRASKGERSLTG